MSFALSRLQPTEWNSCRSPWRAWGGVLEHAPLGARRSLRRWRR
ncbi:DUF3649 domain-containing protein [Hydrogenophaga aromaticivorans]|nr:DUF3649 domain-containing protein [Hydrogenophaga aromaticivorans]